MNTLEQRLKKEIRPFSMEDGTTFYDVAEFLEKGYNNRLVLRWFENVIRTRFPQVTHLAFLESRGYLFSSLSQELSIDSIFITKPGKLLEKDVYSISYDCEYRKGSTLIVRKNSIKKNTNVLIIDDVIATGGSVRAAEKLIEMGGARVVGSIFVLDVGLDHGVKNCVSLANLKDISVPYFPPANHKYQPDCKKFALASPPVEYLAKSMYDYSYLPIDFDQFPDGTPNIKFPSCLADSEVYLFLSCQSKFKHHEDLILQVIARQSVKEFHVVIPYLPSSTMERVPEPGILATAEVDLRMLSSQPMTKNGLVYLHLFNIHAIDEIFYPKDGTVHLIHHTGIDQLLKEISSENFVVAFPDEGSYKRYGHYLKFPKMIFSKERDPQDPSSRIVRLVETKDVPKNFDIKKSKIIIIDDLIHSGGTLIEVAKCLKSMGYDQIYAYATHLIGENNSFMKLLDENSPFTKVYFTDTVPISAMRAKAYSDNLGEDSKAQIIYSTLDMLGKTSRQYVYFNEKRILPSFSNPITVYVPTTCDQKALGVYMFYLKKGVVVNVRKVPGISSKVPEQPINKEVIEGAANRYYLTLEKIGNDKFVVSVENGIVDGNEAVYLFDGSSYYFYDYDYQVDLTNVDLNIYKTYGQYLSEKLGVDPQNWHERIIGISRAEGISRVNEIMKT